MDTSVLTDKGIAQAIDTGNALAASAAEMDLGTTVIVSPMNRAQQTLECVREQLRKGSNSRDFERVEVVPSIREIELHEWRVPLTTV